MNNNNNPADFPVCFVKGVGEKRAKLLQKLGINTAMDLVMHYPRGYIDFNDAVPISEAISEESCVVRATVTKKLTPYRGGRVNIFKCIVSDGSGDMLITFFNSEYSFKRLMLDKEYCFYGKAAGDFLRKEMNSPIFIDADEPVKLLPRYRLTEGLTHNIISTCVKNALSGFDFEDCFSNEFLKEYGLIGYSDALKMIHFPKTKAEYNLAKHRLTFEELFTLQAGLKSLRSRKQKLAGSTMQGQSLEPYYSSLPFTPTNAQKKAIEECTRDMQRNVPMNRLLQGDVGSGKTAVAAATCYFAAVNGYQSTLMAPTEILAKQHYDTLCNFLNPLGINIQLLTGSATASEKKKIRSLIADGTADVVVGTQTLIQKNTEFQNLGLVIADEQHRFGVEQRAALTGKGNNPHTLIMSATPIPRTLGMIIYGDLDISILDEMPKGRLPIKTYAVNTSFHERLYRFILKYVQNGFQAYIVCPLIEEGISEKASAVKYIEGLSETCLKDISIGLLHGKMKQAEKDSIMQAFKANEIKVLVSTTVIEVGVDVPNAVVMLIENAEQFGLSQLHQLRGRVGRGKEQAHCVLITDNESKYTKQRMDTMVRTSDGFEIANEDLKLRGPGDFFGSRQHGLPPLRIADLYADFDILKITEEAADKILKNDPQLEKAENSKIKELIKRLFDNAPNA
ncbi:MAG: ATP-dependent DNA helicase RecG [Ruminiclostridium sp.]|nr:ATP-dependent DNA helicase RecG [Ruminiclostridium sp.]